MDNDQELFCKYYMSVETVYNKDFRIIGEGALYNLLEERDTQLIEAITALISEQKNGDAFDYAYRCGMVKVQDFIKESRRGNEC